MIQNGRFYVFHGVGTQRCPKIASTDLPGIPSVVMRHQSTYVMGVEKKEGSYPPAACKAVVNGTLHVYGKQTVQNLFHASK